MCCVCIDVCCLLVQINEKKYGDRLSCIPEFTLVGVHGSVPVKSTISKFQYDSSVKSIFIVTLHGGRSARKKIHELQQGTVNLYV